LARRRWQNGPFRSRHHRGTPSRVLRPRRDSDAPELLAKRRSGRDPSMEGVQSSCQRSAPELRVDFRARCYPSSVGVAVHAASPASTHGAPTAPAFSSGRACARRASGAPGPSADGRPCSNSHRGGPTPLDRARRVNGGASLRTRSTFHQRRARKSAPLVRCRTSHGACSPIGRGRSARCLGAGTATTALALRTPDTARQLLQSTRNPSTPAW
jgi:hypothetical protein